MFHTALALFAAAQITNIMPIGDTSAVRWGKATGYLVSGDGVGFEVTGPIKVMVTVAGRQELRNTVVQIEIVRDDTHVSRNQIKLRAKRGGPKGYPAQGSVGFQVVEGTHKLFVRSNKTVVASLKAAKRIPRGVRAAAEVELPRAVAEAPALKTEPEPPPPEPEPPQVPEPEAPPTEEITAVPADAAGDSAELATKRSVTNLVQAKRVAVYDLEISDIDPTIGAVVTDSLVTEIRKLQGISVIGMDEIRDMLSHEANKQFLGCESDESCLAEIAGALGVDDLVTGKLSKVADNHVMLVRRIDQNRAKVTGVYDQRLAAETGQEFLLSVGPAVEQLFPTTPLRGGLTRGVAEEVALRLDPPPLPPWSFYSVAGAAMAAAAAGGVFGLLANSAESSFQATASGSGTIEGRELVEFEDQANARALGANVSYSVAGGLAVTAAVMFLFTDWHGYGDVQVSR